MEPKIIDYYNEMPHGVDVIDKMNEELAKLQKENDILRGGILSIVHSRDQVEGSNTINTYGLNNFDRYGECVG